MQVLIVESNHELGALWQSHLERLGVKVLCVSSQTGAVNAIRNIDPRIIILNVKLPGESSFAIADFAAYRLPEARVIFVTSDTFFSDGSIFSHVPNACAFVQTAVPPDDLCAMVEYYGNRVLMSASPTPAVETQT